MVAVDCSNLLVAQFPKIPAPKFLLEHAFSKSLTEQETLIYT